MNISFSQILLVIIICFLLFGDFSKIFFNFNNLFLEFKKLLNKK